MSKSVSQKMGVKEGSRAFFKNVSETARAALKLPSLEVSSKLVGDFDYLHLFIVTQDEMNDIFPRLKAHLKPRGMLWVSWPKGRQLDTDLSLPKVIHIGYSHGLVESTCLSVDATWSALKFTHPKKDRIYNNSYGQLPTE